MVAAMVLTFQSCLSVYQQTSSGSTESFIKNFVEEHKEGEFSSIKTCLIFKGPAINGGMIELTGYKYGMSKNLVIAASESYSTPAARGQAQPTQSVKKETAFIQLTSDQAKLIVENYKALEAKIKGEQPIVNEIIYHDFTASSNLFVSYSRSSLSYGSQATNYMHLWIKGNKFTISSTEVVKRLEAFLKY